MANQLLPLPQTPAQAQAIYAELLLDSQNYWSEVRGSPDPPAPSFRLIKGKQKLGRYMDPFGATGLMIETKAKWHQWYPTFLVGSAAGPVFTGVTVAFTVLLLPVLVVWYLCKRAYFRRQYDHYWAVLQEIERTGQPVWVAYNKARLQRIDLHPNAVWP